MTKKAILVIVSVIMVLGMFIGASGCSTTEPAAAPEKTTAPTQTAAPEKTANPEPSVEKTTWVAQTFIDTTPPYGVFTTDKYPYAGGVAPGHYWVDWLEDTSNGRLEIDMRPANSVVPAADLLKAVGTGVLDMAIAYSAYWTGTIPEANIQAGLPGGPNTAAEIYDWLYNWGIHDLCVEVYAEHNVLPIEFGNGSMTSIGADFPMPDMASLKGKKIRATGLFGDWVELVGGSPVAIDWSDVYMAQKLGTIDGWCSAVIGMEASKLKEVSSGFLVNPLPGSAVPLILINLDSLDKLPEDLQDLIKDTSQYVLSSYAPSWMENTYILANSVSDVTGETLVNYHWPEEEVKWVNQQVVDKIWSKIADASPRCAEMIEISTAWMKAYGKID